MGNFSLEKINNRPMLQMSDQAIITINKSVPHHPFLQQINRVDMAT